MSGTPTTTQPVTPTKQPVTEAQLASWRRLVARLLRPIAADERESDRDPLCW